MPLKNKRYIYPEFAYETMLDILEKFDLKKKNEQISEEMFSLPEKDPKFDILFEDLPERFLFAISRDYLGGIIKKEALPEMISGKLGLGIEKSKELLEDLENRILSQVEIIKEGDEEEEIKKIEPIQEQVSSQSIKAEKENLTSPKIDDPYREKID